MLTDDLKVVRQSGWGLLHRKRQLSIPTGLNQMISSKGSLTAQLRLFCGDRFNVQLLSQTVCLPDRDERACLGIATGRWMMVREVLLRCDDTPLVFARTIIPLSTLTGVHRCLAKLGSKPLGEVLFSDPHMTRGEIEVAAFTCDLPGIAANGSRQAWGRRSVFYLGNKPLLVSEVFIPGWMNAEIDCWKS